MVIQSTNKHFRIRTCTPNVEGVQSVPKCEIVNKCGGTYSNVKYNISNLKNKQVYPSLDPSVFELKYPNKDIKGRVV